MTFVDRGNFCPFNPYRDAPQSIGYGVTISAPHMVKIYYLKSYQENLYPRPLSLVKVLLLVSLFGCRSLFADLFESSPCDREISKSVQLTSTGYFIPQGNKIFIVNIGNIYISCSGLE